MQPGIFRCLLDLELDSPRIKQDERTHCSMASILGHDEAEMRGKLMKSLSSVSSAPSLMSHCERTPQA